MLAEAAVVIHFGFLVWVFFGGLAVLWRPRLAWGHLPCVAWAVFVTVTAMPCPLTWTEKWLMVRGGLPAYAGGFLDYYVDPTLIRCGVSETFIPYLGYVLLGINLFVYALVIARRFQRSPALPASVSPSAVSPQPG